ncbi:MAG: hypothetical protein ACREJ3_09350 [Polyangiaceae bacterium]
MSTRSKSASATPQPWLKHFFQRHRDDDPTQAVPARDFLTACPEKVRAMMMAVVDAVANAPPPQFSGGGKWEAMHGDMAGYCEIRVDGPKRHHYRLFCLLERKGVALGLGGASLVLICGKDKAFRTVLSARDYADVRRLGTEYLARLPRSVIR